MKDILDEVTRLGRVVGHEREVALVHLKHGDGIPGDLLLRQRNCYTGVRDLILGYPMR